MVLINLTTASMDLKVDQARTKKVKLNKFTVRGGQLSYKSITHVVSAILIAIVFFLHFSHPLLMEGLLYYIAPSGPP